MRPARLLGDRRYGKTSDGQKGAYLGIVKHENQPPPLPQPSLLGFPFPLLLTPPPSTPSLPPIPPHSPAPPPLHLSLSLFQVLEHNLCAVGRIYASIRFADLAALLETDATKAQVIAAQMCNGGVIRATIDQVGGVLYFTAGLAGKEEREKDWDGAVRVFCDGLNDCADRASAAVEAGGEMKQ